MRKVRFALIGAGSVAKIHAKSILEIEDAELVAVWTRNREKGMKFAKEFKIDYHVDFKDILIRKDVDAVCILTPSGTHADIGIQAARAGKHVIVEKPIDVDLKKADLLIEECGKRNVKLSVISQRRFSDAVITVRNSLKNGELGKVNFGGAQIKWYRTQEYYDSSLWRGTWKLDGGGALINQSIHYVDLLQYLVAPVEEVFSYYGTKAHDIEVEDMLVGTLKFRNGALGLIEATTAAWPGLFSRLDIYAENGTASLVNDELEFLLTKKGKKFEKKNSSQGSRAATSDIAYHLHRKQLEGIIGSILNNKRPEVTGKDGRNALAVVMALYESCKIRKPLKVNIME